MNITEFEKELLERELNDLRTDDYKTNGFKDRMEYLESLADEYCTDIDTVLFMAEILGPSEDFDGLVTSLQDEYEKQGYLN